jgi:hypothetical protein
MKKLLPAILAAVLLLVGATVALAQTEDPDTSATTVDDGATPADVARGHGDRGRVLQSVLDDLVEDGTLTQAQADAVIAGIDEKKAEFQVQREELRAAWDEAWADDVLTEDEAAALVGDGPFGDAITDPEGPLADYWTDGQLTRDELAEARASLGFGRRGHHRGAFGGNNSETPETEESSFPTLDPAGQAGA